MSVYINQLFNNYIFDQKLNELIIDNVFDRELEKTIGNAKPIFINAKKKYALLLELGESIQPLKSYVEKEIHSSGLNVVFQILRENIKENLGASHYQSIIVQLPDRSIFNKFLTIFNNWDFNAFVSDFVLSYFQLEHGSKTEIMLLLIQNKNLNLSPNALNILLKQTYINNQKEITDWLISLLTINIIMSNEFDLNILLEILIRHDIVDSIPPLTILKKDLMFNDDFENKRINKSKTQLIEETILRLKVSRSGCLSLTAHQYIGGLSVTNNDSGGLSITD